MLDEELGGSGVLDEELEVPVPPHVIVGFVMQVAARFFGSPGSPPICAMHRPQA